MGARLGIVGAVLVIALGCTDGGQTGDPGDFPAPMCSADDDCAEHEPAALEGHLPLLIPDGGTTATGTVRASRCRGFGCVFVVEVEGVCYVAGDTSSHDCSMSDDEILAAAGL